MRTGWSGRIQVGGAPVKYLRAETEEKQISNKFSMLET